MDEIDHDHLMEFRNWLITRGNEHRFTKNSGHAKRTANRKASHVNQLVKITLGLPDGKGPITKSDPSLGSRTFPRECLQPSAGTAAQR